MNFDFTDDQLALRDAVARWVDKAHGFERRHALAAAGGATRVVLGELNNLGLMGLAVSDAHGGMGFGPVEAMVVMEELGRGIVSAPYAQAALIAPLLLARADAAVQAAWLPRVADGSALVVLAHQEHAARYRLDRVAAVAQRRGDAWTIDGAKSVVPSGDEADAFIVPALADGALGLFVVEKAAAASRGYPTQDGARAAEVELRGAAATPIVIDAPGSPAARDALDHALDVGIAAACAEGVGLMDRLLAVTVEYMNTRKQFGVAIASFQALRHRVADVKMQIELARSMSYYATLKLNDAPAPAPGRSQAGAAPLGGSDQRELGGIDQRRRALSQAKVQLGASMRFVGQQCVQLHGGIGVTDEYVASHIFKRLTMLELAYGDSMHHLGEVSARMQDTAGVFS